jgi:hypothetical protein
MAAGKLTAQTEVLIGGLPQCHFVHHKSHKTGAATFLSNSSSIILKRDEWTPLQTHCHSENLVEPGIEPGTSGLAARNSDY